MIKLFSSQYNESFKEIQQFKWQEFEEWLLTQTEFQFDIETSVSPHWMERKLMTLQFGSMTEDLQYVFEYALLSTEQLQVIKKVLESWDVEKVIHNAAFEYIICKFYNTEIHNVFCTMLAEKVINGGLENADYALADISIKYCEVYLDKTYQKSFGDGVLTYEKVVYAADDVKYLSLIKEQQLVELRKWELL